MTVGASLIYGSLYAQEEGTGSLVNDKISERFSQYMGKNSETRQETDFAILQLDSQFKKLDEIEKIMKELVDIFSDMMQGIPKKNKEETKVKNLVEPLETLYNTHYFACLPEKKSNSMLFSNEFIVTLHCLRELEPLVKVLTLRDSKWDYDAYKIKDKSGHSTSPVADFCHTDAVKAYNTIVEIKNKNLSEHDHVVKAMFDKVFPRG